MSDNHHLQRCAGKSHGRSWSAEGKIDLVLEILLNKRSVQEAAQHSGISPETISEWIDLYLHAAKQSADTRRGFRKQSARRRRPRPALVATICLLLLCTAAVGTAAVVEDDCTDNLPICFAANTPARASEINQNFASVSDWIEDKTGPLAETGITTDAAAVVGDLDVGGNQTVAGNAQVTGDAQVSGAATISGAATVGGNLTVAGNVLGLTVTINEDDCETVSSGTQLDGGAIIYLDRARFITCPANKVLVDWDIYNVSNNYRMEYKCCGLTVQ